MRMVLLTKSLWCQIIGGGGRGNKISEKLISWGGVSKSGGGRKSLITN